MRAFSLWLVLLSLLALPALGDTITGTVVDPEGKPVEGAEVYVTTYAASEVASLRTDAAGRFATELKVGTSHDDAFGRVVVLTPGFAIGGGPLKSKDDSYQLGPAGQLWGTVADKQGNPVAGATVTLQGLLGSDQAWRSYYRQEWREKFQVKTTADGKYAFTQVPLEGVARVALTDPRFAETFLETSLGPKAAPAPPLVAVPGSTLVGRVVFADGKPAAGIYVGTFGRLGIRDQATAQDGSYRLAGLGGGKYSVQVQKPPEGFVTAPVRDLLVGEGAEVRIPDFVLTPGAILQGTVSDAETGAPIAHAYVTADGGFAGYGASDDSGRYRLRVLPGQTRISASAAGYASLARGESVTLAESETGTLDFQLTKGLTFSALVVDPAGRPAVGATAFLFSGRDFPDEHRGRSDESGQVQITGLAPGRYLLNGEGDWEPAERQEVAMPSPSSVKLVMRKTRPFTLAGRAVSDSGDPIPGAVVQVTAMIAHSPNGGNARIFNLTTDTEGRYSLSGLRSDAEPRVTAEKEGYRYVSGGEVAKTEIGYEATDIVFARLGGKLSGKVVDANGQPVAGAEVMSPSGDPHELVVTDAAGEFTLGKLPAGEVYIVAAHASLAGDARVMPGSRPVTITLKPIAPLQSQDIQRGFSILWEAQRKSANGEYYARDYMSAELAPYDPDLALKLTQEPDGTVPDRTVELTIYRLAEMNPAKAAQWAPPHLEQIKDRSTRAQAALSLGLAVRQLDPALARRLYEEAKPALDLTQPLTGDCSSDLFARVNLVALAGGLDDPEAPALLEKLIADLRALDERLGHDTGGYTEAALESVARGNPRLAEQAMQLADLKGRAVASALSRVMPVLARIDPEAAARLLPTLAAQNDEARREAERQHADWADWYSGALRALVSALGPRDPVLALKLARQGSDKDAEVLALAARFQPKEAAAPLFREAVQRTTYPGLLAHLAAMAYERDPALGRELFAQARTALDQAEEYIRRFSTPEFAFYYARVQPAESRLLLEESFSAALQKEGEGGDPDAVLRPALAMAAVDMDRALEMARAIPSSEGGCGDARFDAQRKLAQYVLAPDSVRRTMPFDRWDASDTWMPGTPTGW